MQVEYRAGRKLIYRESFPIVLFYRASITELPKGVKVRKRMKFSFDYVGESKNIRSSLPFVATQVGEEEDEVLFDFRI